MLLNIEDSKLNVTFTYEEVPSLRHCLIQNKWVKTDMRISELKTTWKEIKS